MILILSTPSDFTTDKVIDWLDFFKSSYCRIEPRLLLCAAGGMSIPIDTNSHIMQVNGKTLDIRDVKVVWYRKWHYWRDIKYPEFESLDDNISVANLMIAEYKSISDYLFELFDNAIWLNNPAPTTRSKISQLSIAQRIGLRIPKTIIASYKSDLQSFFDIHGKLSPKALKKVSYLDRVFSKFPHLNSAPD